MNGKTRNEINKANTKNKNNTLKKKKSSFCSKDGVFQKDTYDSGSHGSKYMSTIESKVGISITRGNSWTNVMSCEEKQAATQKRTFHKKKGRSMTGKNKNCCETRETPTYTFHSCKQRNLQQSLCIFVQKITTLQGKNKANGKPLRSVLENIYIAFQPSQYDMNNRHPGEIN